MVTDKETNNNGEALSTRVDPRNTSETLAQALISDYLDPDDYRDLSIMVIDDTAASLMHIAPLLSDQGYAVRPVKDSRSVVQSALDDPPDLIITDVVMPAPDGFEICRQLKENPHTSHIPVILLSARDDAAYKSKGFELGAVDYITKPFKEQEVLSRVKTHISSALLKRQLEERNHRLSREIRENKENRIRFQTIFDATSVPMLVIDTEYYTILQSNHVANDVLGYSERPEGINGLSLEDLIVEPERTLRYLKNDYPQEEKKLQILHFRHPKGENISYEVQFFDVDKPDHDTILLILSSRVVDSKAQSSKISELSARSSGITANPISAPSGSNHDPFAELYQMLLYHQAGNNMQLFQSILDRLLECFKAREGHIIIEGYLEDFASKRDGSSTTSTSRQHLKIVAQKHRYDVPLSLTNEGHLDNHPLRDIIYCYGQPLFCDEKTALYISPSLRKFMHNLEIPWIFFIPLTSIFANRGSIVLFGEGHYLLNRNDIIRAEILGQYFGYTLDRIAHHGL